MVGTAAGSDVDESELWENNTVGNTIQSVINAMIHSPNIRAKICHVESSGDTRFTEKMFLSLFSNTGYIVQY